MKSGIAQAAGCGSTEGKDAKAVKKEGIIPKLARCAWLAFVWMPIFWPLWISMWMLSPFTGSGGRGKQPDREEAGEEKDDSRKISTQGSLGLFIIVAAVVLRVSCLLALKVPATIFSGLGCKCHCI